MLEEDTRHSLSIEGVFASEQELEAVLTGRRVGPEILNYYRTAEFVYGLGLEYYHEGNVRLEMPLVRQVHASLFNGMTERRGEFRRGPIRIQGAQVKPPELDIEQYVRVFLQLCRHLMECPLLEGLARVHVLFESIHPFEDGNGRTGRILLNYLAISTGCPPIVIKGLTQAERNRYYQALEAADKGFHGGFPAPSADALAGCLKEGDFGAMEGLLYEGLLPRLDRVIAAACEREEPLQPLKEVAQHFGVKEATLRKWSERGKLIAVKRNNRLLSHPRLYLGSGD